MANGDVSRGGTCLARAVTDVTEGRQPDAPAGIRTCPTTQAGCPGLTDIEEG